MKGFLHIVNINNFLSKISKNQLVKERAFLIVLITILITIWFRKGLILGSGESGLPFYNTSRLLEELKSNWSDVPLGAAGSISFPSYPLYATITFFQHLNVPSYILQAAFYFLIFVIGVLSIHKIASFIKGNSPLSRFSSALFYIFNPIVHISILHRFQYPLIFFYAFMPLAFLIYLKGLKSKNFIYLVFLSLVSLIFSFAFVGPAFLELFFGILGFLSIFVFISTFRKERDYFPLFYFLVFVVIFTLVNSWWLAPLLGLVFVDLGSRGSVKYFNPSDNVNTFKGISDQIQSVLGVFRLFKPNDIPKDDSSWGWIYGTAPFIFLSFFSAVAFIVGLFKKEKELLYKFLILVAFIVMFWMKGTLAPFGGVTLRLFEWFTFLHVFRNPFEKIGVLLPFAMAIPVGFGIRTIINVLANRLKLSKKIMTFLILILVFPIYMFPIVTGLVFTGGPPPSNNMDIGQYVRVPSYYKDAREWLDQQADVFRVLVLPINGEGMTYKWEYGYAGTELSNNLFNQSMISFNTSQGGLPEIIDSIKETLLNYPDKLWILAQILNVKYIMVRDDIDYLARETESPATDIKLINENMNQHFTQVAEFDKLKFFELKKDEFYPRVFPATSAIYLLDPADNYLKLIPFSSPKRNDIFITSKLGEDPYNQLTKTKVLSGLRVENIKIDSKNPIENLPYVSIFRDTPFYALVRLKEDFVTQFLAQDEQLAFKINLLGKRIVELNQSPENLAAIDEYNQGVRNIAQELLVSKSVGRILVEGLISQKETLEEIMKKTSHKEKINQIISFLDSLFIQLGAKSIYPTEKSLIHRFYIPKDSNYEVLIAKENWEKYFEDSGINDLDLDGKTIKLDSSQQISGKDALSLGIYTLNQGVHEVSIAHPKTKNLIAEKLPEELILSSKDKQPLTKEIPISELDNAYEYGLSFEYLEEKGNVPVVTLHSDADFIDNKGERVARFGIALTRDDYDFAWKKYIGNFTPFPSAREHSIAFRVLPYGDCEAVVQRPYRRYCKDDNFSKRTLRDSSYKIRNLRIEKVFHNLVVLREQEATSSSNITPQIDFEKITSARYKVKVTDAQNPFFLVLSTTFDPRWNAYFVNSQLKTLEEQLPEKNHLMVNGYANAWYIERPGSYEMFLEYSPERVFIIGKRFSVLVIVTLLLIIFYKIYVKYRHR